jgi:D-tyrosyl-tRNA(Tyr) deacylase
MIAVIQRVSEALVLVGSHTVGSIGPGLLALVAVHGTDTPADVAWTANKLVGLRVFDRGGKGFDLDVRQVGGQVLLVSNFTVAAATRSGRRPSFDPASDPARGLELFDALVEAVRATGVPVRTGQFGADMRVILTNEGPVTLILDSRATGAPGTEEDPGPKDPA